MQFISTPPPARDAGGVMLGVNSVPGFSGHEPMKYCLADLSIDTGRQLFSRADFPITLPKLSYDLLLALVRAAPNLVSLDELMRSRLALSGSIGGGIGFRRAREIDPYFNEPWYWRYVGLTYTILRRYREALAAFGYLTTHPYRVSAYMAGCYARLGELDRAQASAAECLALKPEFSIGHFMSKQPFKSSDDAASLAESLRMAGLPD